MNIVSILRRILPRRLISALRLISVFQWGHGHTLRSKVFPVNSKGEYLPWLTYPLLEFMEGLDFAGKRIFEFGSGASTLYWSSRAQEIVSVEFDSEWFETLKLNIPDNVQLILESDGYSYASKIKIFEGCFDVIVIDGAERYRCAQSAIKKLAPGGFIILDNAEWYPNTADFLAQSGLIEIRFSGFGPINAFTSTSSIFMNPDFSFPRCGSSRLQPVGGKALEGPAPDDVAPVLEVVN